MLGKEEQELIVTYLKGTNDLAKSFSDISEFY